MPPFSDYLKNMTVGIVASNRQWCDGSGLWPALRDGLRGGGCHVVFSTFAGLEAFSEPVDMVFVWNGAKGSAADAACQCRSRGERVIIMERGFFDRMNHTQFDHEGFNHRASWRDCMTKSPTAEAVRRLNAVWGKVTPMRARRKGYILVLLQVPGDSQLNDSELRHPDPLVELVEACSRQGIEIRVRHHPMHGWKCGQGRRSGDIGGSLAENVEGARFCVTINSNSANEAIAMGCPVLCMGPALYAHAGVAMATSAVGMRDSIRLMLGGWQPARGACERYLCQLASRQYSSSEIRQGDVLERIMEAAL